MPCDYSVSDVYLLNSEPAATVMPLHILFRCSMADSDSKSLEVF